MGPRVDLDGCGKSCPHQHSIPGPMYSSKKYIRLNCGRILCVEIIQLYSVVFYVVRAVHKFYFRLVINETPEKWRPE
jgi:hypothetical protein